MSSPHPPLREVDPDALHALERALAGVTGGQVGHLYEPAGVHPVAAGGSPLWSVAYAAVGGDVLLVTCGNSAAVDPARAGVHFELSLRVPRAGGVGWPAGLLRQLAWYMVTHRIELGVSDFLPTAAPIDRIAHGAEPTTSPPTAMDAVFLVADPVLPTIATPRGPIEIRRVVGIHPGERELLESWCVQGLVQTMARWLPDLTTDPLRPSLTADPWFVDMMRSGSRREGSDFPYCAVNGIDWDASGAGFQLTLPGGRDARRIHRMVAARLQHGRRLLIHDTDPGRTRAIVIQPAETWDLSVEGPIAYLSMPPDAPHLDVLADAPEREIVWRLR